MTRSTFKNNAVLVNLPGWDQGAGGLGIIVAPGVNNTFVKIDSCVFEGNTSTQSDAGLFVYSEGGFSNTVMENCLIKGNTAALNGGGIGFYPVGTNFHATVRHTRITDNQSSGAGGAVRISRDFLDVPFPATASMLFENCLIAGNTSTGAAIFVDSMPDLQLLHSTIANNTGGGIQLSDQSGLTLQNTILYNPGFADYTAGTPDVTVTSLGGNLIGDGSLASYALSYDLQNTDPLFAAPGDYHLAGNSPAIDKGIDPGTLPALDLDGNARVNGCVDIGAYESPVIVSVACVVSGHELQAAGRLSVSPNPTVDFLQIQLSEMASAAPTDLQVFDAQGRMLMQRTLSGGQALDVRDLAPGMYALRVMQGGRAYAGRFVKG